MSSESNKKDQGVRSKEMSNSTAAGGKPNGGAPWLMWEGRESGPSGGEESLPLEEPPHSIGDGFVYPLGQVQEARYLGSCLLSSSEPQDGFSKNGRLYLGPNTQWGVELTKELEGEVALIYMDPPYGTGTERNVLRGGGKQPHRQSGKLGFFDQRATESTYLRQLHDVFVLCRKLLTHRGQLFVHVDYRASGIVRVLLDEIFGADSLRNEIIWHYESGGRPKNFYARKSDTIFWYAKGKDATFHPERISHPRNRCWRCGGELETWNHMRKHTDEEGRVYRTIKSAGRVYRYYDDEPVPPSNVWMDIPIIHQKDPQRTGYPTQKPLALMERIVAAHTEKGDLVMDPFCGSGSTLVAAASMERRWVGVDRNPLAIGLSRRRLETVSKDPFSVFWMKAQQGDFFGEATTDSVGEGGDEERKWARMVSPVVEGDRFGVMLDPKCLEDKLEHWTLGVRRNGDSRIDCFWWSTETAEAKIALESPQWPIRWLVRNGQLVAFLQKVDGEFFWVTIHGILP